MHTDTRPRARDLPATLAAGAGLGFRHAPERNGLLPLFLVHGALLHAFWSRVYLPRIRHGSGRT